MKLTDSQVLELLKGNSNWNKARQEFSNGRGQISNASNQRTPLSPIEMRRMEFEAVAKIASILGLDL